MVGVDCSQREVKACGYRGIVTEYTGVSVWTFADLYVYGLTGFVYAGGGTAGGKLPILSCKAVPWGGRGELELSGCNIIAQGIVDNGVEVDVIADHQSKGVQDGSV